MESKRKAGTVVVRRKLHAPAAKVWQALTDPQQMKEWYFDLPGFRAEVGYEFRFSAGETPEKEYVHLCKVTAVVPGKKLSYSWRYEGYPGESFVTFTLSDQGDTTWLQITHRQLDTFPASNPDFAPGNFAAGWKHILHTSLRAFLEK